jgi:hypothetical protein
VRRPRGVRDKHDHHRAGQRHGNNMASGSFFGRYRGGATDESNNDRGPTSEEKGRETKSEKKKKKKKKIPLFDERTTTTTTHHAPINAGIENSKIRTDKMRPRLSTFSFFDAPPAVTPPSSSAPVSVVLVLSATSISAFRLTLGLAHAPPAHSSVM